MRARLLCPALLFTFVCVLEPFVAQGQILPNLLPFPNRTGFAATYNESGKPIDLSNPFFQALGTNGRSCSTCHRPAEGWSISTDEIRFRFEITQGKDPLFRTVDGSNCGTSIDTSTLSGRRQAYSLLLERGVLRVQLPVPENAEFEVMSVANPYGCNDAQNVSVYRRSLPSANLRFLSGVMWDGRESTPQTGTQKITFTTNPADLHADLRHQALDATNGHAEGQFPLTPEQQKEIADFEAGLTTAQVIDYVAGRLDVRGAKGGPRFIAERAIPEFYVGINDPLGENPKGVPFNPSIFHLFTAWKQSASGNGFFEQFARARRESIARGEELFNSKPIRITGVSGLNDDLNVAAINGTCGTCHDTPSVGNHSFPAPLNIGVGDLDSPLDVSYLPVFTLRNKQTGEIREITDPGRALITGAWKDVGRMKGPTLRALSSRAPYFHNGSARTLNEVVEFYDKRFGIGFTDQEKRDLIAFLSAL